MDRADDLRHMTAALTLAARGLGRVWPNPAVGCVLVNPSGQVVGRGWTQPGGRPHAETEALRRAGAAAHGATAYVTLEPCSHHGRTAPCADALVAAGVGRVVAALEDPDPRVRGSGLARLEAAGIPVTLGVGAEVARELNAGFLKRVTLGVPLVTLKLATSLDGRIATLTGDSQWITGAAARARGHLLRANHDAILVGRATALADDPLLTCRLPGLEERSPVRVVLDSGLKTPVDAALVRTARDVPTWIVSTAPADAERARLLAAAGVEILEVAADASGGVSVREALHALGSRGITRLLVEGGAGVAASFLKAGLVDRMVWFRAGCIIGGDGRAVIDPLGIAALAEAIGLTRRDVGPCGEDLVETYAVDG